jgi:hypothetical protein
MITASRQILVLGFMLALLIAAAAALSAGRGRPAVGVSAPTLPRAEPLATIDARGFERRWNGQAAEITLASR